jgi:hypothetical protein
MAVIQISQIQIRRGFLDDLGQLGAGEFGWAVDRLRLFIGNGSVADGAAYEGNTEILTQYTDILSLISSYKYRGLIGGYEVETGPSHIAPTKRALQAKVDDTVNILDFGAVGDGVVDNSVAIQRAIDELYGRRATFTPVPTRRTIRFHPGIYSISTELRIPPYCVFENTGKDSVIIKLIQKTGITPANCIIKTTTGTGISTDLPNNGLDFYSLLGPVEMRGITFKTDIPGIPLVVVDSAKDVTFHRCQFEGKETTRTMPGNSCGVKITSLASSTGSIFFSECDFTKSSAAALIFNDEGISEVVFDRCTFYDLFQGIDVFGNVQQVVGVKVISSVFDLVSAQGIRTRANVDGVVSSFNTFLNVGNSQNADQSPASPVIQFGGNVSYSIGDIFTRTIDNDVIVPTVLSENGSVASTHFANEMRFGNTYQVVGKSVVVNNNSVNYIPIPAKYKSGIIDYSLERNNTVRSGTLKFSLDKNINNFDYYDSYTESDPTGVDVSVEYSPLPGPNTSPYIICVADSRGQPSVLTYDIKSLLL